MTTRRLLSTVAAASLVLAACGGSDSDDGDAVTTDAPAVDDATDTEDPGDDFTEVDGEEVDGEDTDTTLEVGDETIEEPPPVTDDGAAEDPADDADVGDAAAGGAIDVSLVEWAIEAPTEYVAGDVTFTATNNGGFPHELVVIQGESYESLPLEEGGAVLEDELPTGALIGRTARFGGGASESLTVTLAPGNYVLVCNLGGGATSHAGQGQRLDITVS